MSGRLTTNAVAFGVGHVLPATIMLWRDSDMPGTADAGFFGLQAAGYSGIGEIASALLMGDGETISFFIMTLATAAYAAFRFANTPDRPSLMGVGCSGVAGMALMITAFQALVATP